MGDPIAALRPSGSTMSDWGLQLVVGRLLTDAEFRRNFAQGRRDCLEDLRDHGIDLNEAQFSALMEVDVDAWSTMAMGIDPRLQRGRLASDASARRASEPGPSTQSRASGCWPG